MPTSISLSPDLLARVDRVAQRRDMSRSRYINVVLTQALARDDDWPHSLFDGLIESAMMAELRAKAEAAE